MDARARKLNNADYVAGSVIYWMSRDQRLQDNWALRLALNFANKHNAEFEVVFCLSKKFLHATSVHFDFMLAGLQQVADDAAKCGIKFTLLKDSPELALPDFVKRKKIGAVFSDFSPLKINRKWKKDILAKIMDVPFYEVDAHNIVPCWVASPKLEFAAYTFRPKIKHLLSQFLTVPPKITTIGKPLKPEAFANQTNKSGPKAATTNLRYFIDNKLKDYSAKRNDPTVDAQSNLSAHLHFGQISAARIALEIKKQGDHEDFLEELIVRRELADNFCMYNSNYDNFEGFPAWAKITLNAHRQDKREYLYDLDTFENARTHDELWNAAQRELLTKNKMHGFMRMYWAKKILEWTDSPEQAMEIAIYLNDKYQLDGRDPNGYTGIAWSIGGVHDRAWGTRPVFGKIRYMNYNGAKRKFDVQKYIAMNS